MGIYDGKQHESIFDRTLTKEELLKSERPKARKSAAADSITVEAPEVVNADIGRAVDNAIPKMRETITKLFTQCH